MNYPKFGFLRQTPGCVLFVKGSTESNARRYKQLLSCKLGKLCWYSSYSHGFKAQRRYSPGWVHFLVWIDSPLQTADIFISYFLFKTILIFQWTTPCGGPVILNINTSSARRKDPRQSTSVVGSSSGRLYLVPSADSQPARPAVTDQ
ncbi:hypothetical protein RRG08_027394 [Elysia crispata]|uniref:Uncharacterized protein n=1 Tax=Elysia crispata TaxID=231223 RepID=A0AAE0YFU5_9GAST|nr:hypothetical protein RRG08_027394 [Elysia crispata]